MNTFNHKLVKQCAVAFVSLSLLSAGVMAQLGNLGNTLNNTVNNTVNTVTGTVTNLTAKVKNDTACIKGRLVIEGLKPVGGTSPERQEKLERTGNALQSLCSNYTDFATANNQNKRVELAATIGDKANVLQTALTDFVNSETQANVEYTADNYGQLAAVSVALKLFNVLLVKQKALPHDATEDQVLSVVIQSTNLAGAHVKTLLLTAPEGLFSANEQPKNVAVVEPSSVSVN